jgi:hypothetical protein
MLKKEGNGGHNAQHIKLVSQSMLCSSCRTWLKTELLYSSRERTKIKKNTRATLDQVVTSSQQVIKPYMHNMNTHLCVLYILQQARQTFLCDQEYIQGDS